MPKKHVSLSVEAEGTGDRNYGDKASGEGRNEIQETVTETYGDNGNVEESESCNLLAFIAYEHASFHLSWNNS